MLLYSRHFSDLAILFASLGALYVVARWMIQTEWIARDSKRVRRVRILAVVASLLMFTGIALTFNQVARPFPVWWSTWIKGVGITVCLWVVALIPVAWFWKSRTASRFNPSRRAMLNTARAVTFAAPVVLTGFAFVRRNDLRLNEVDIPIPGLPRDLDGLRLVQLSDIHMSPFLSEADLARAIDMANETKPHIALVTGDLISVHGDPLDVCLRQLARLKSDAGTLGCLGNHEIHAETSDYTEQQGARLGMNFLRSRSRILEFGSARLNIGGVDYQRFGYPYLERSGSLVQPGMTNILLSHNPDVFPVAAKQGWNLTLGGHTHGGQVNFEILSTNVNIMRFYTPYVYGKYSQDGSSIFVTRGIGTVGIPARIGAPPEVALIRLRTA
jgi:uncharacterized protein